MISFRGKRLLPLDQQKQNAPAIMPLVIGGCLLFGLSLGIRMNYGILLNAYADYAGLPYGKISLVVAIGELVYGLTQPLFGILAICLSAGTGAVCFGIVMGAITPFIPKSKAGRMGIINASSGLCLYDV